MDSPKRSGMRIGVLCALSCEVLFGMSYMFTKQAMANASAFSLLGWRFLLAFAVVRIAVSFGAIKIDLNKTGKGTVALLSLFSPVLYFVGETIGIRNTTASESGVILACIPVASLLSSAFFLRKKPTRVQIVGILMTLAGVSVTVLAAGGSAGFSLFGYAFLLLAVASYAFYCVLVEKAAGYSGMEITYVMLRTGAAAFVLLALGEAAVSGSLWHLAKLPLIDAGFLVAVLYQGIGCSLVAFLLSNLAIARIGVNRAASFIGVSTLVSILAGALVLRESFTAYQAVGAAVILAGVYTANAGAPAE